MFFRAVRILCCFCSMGLHLQFFNESFLGGFLSSLGAPCWRTTRIFRIQIASSDPRSTWVCLKAFRGFNPSGKCPSTTKRNRWNRMGFPWFSAYTVNQGPFFPLGIDRNGWEVSYPNLPLLAPNLFFRQLFKVAKGTPAFGSMEDWSRAMTLEGIRSIIKVRFEWRTEDKFSLILF